MAAAGRHRSAQPSTHPLPAKKKMIAAAMARPGIEKPSVQLMLSCTYTTTVQAISDPMLMAR
jgi:hypothetical protein